MSALPSGLLLFFFACSSTLGCFNGRGGGRGTNFYPPIVQALFPPTENDKDPAGKGNGGLEEEYLLRSQEERKSG